MRHVGQDDRERLQIELLSEEAQRTSAIEGEELGWLSVQSSLRRHLGLTPDAYPMKPREQGVSALMVDVHSSFQEPLSHETPPSATVSHEMEALITWFNQTAQGGPKPLSALIRVGIGHLWFESIHPFEDGNGRLGRALAEKSLAQSIGDASFSSMTDSRVAIHINAARSISGVTSLASWHLDITSKEKSNAWLNIKALPKLRKLVSRPAPIMM